MIVISSAQHIMDCVHIGLNNDNTTIIFIGSQHETIEVSYKEKSICLRVFEVIKHAIKNNLATKFPYLEVEPILQEYKEFENEDLPCSASIGGKLKTKID